MSDGTELHGLIADLARMLRVEADRRARTLGLTRAQWVILWRVAQAPGRSQRELAEVLEVEPITVARLVDRLEAADLVERRPDPGDRRVWRLHPGSGCAEMLRHLEPARTQIAALVTDCLPAADLATLRTLLETMRDRLAASRRHKQEAA
jgi:DNA-binding MarR family transcriptional regulator